MRFVPLLWLLVFLVAPSLVFGQSCTTKATFIPTSDMSAFINRYIDSVVPSNTLATLIVNPNMDSLLTYSKSLMPIIIPIFAFAAIACIFCMVACIQICCVGCFQSSKCRCINYTYTGVKILTGLTITLLILLTAGSVAGMIFNHDVLAASSNTGCEVENVFNKVINGDSSTGWDGLTNLSQQVNSISVQFANNIQSISSELNSSSATMAKLTAGGTTYMAVQNSAACTISIPTSFDCPNGTAASCQTSTIDQFCNVSASGMAGSLISNEFNNTVFTYGNTLTQVTNTINTMYTNNSTVISSLSQVQAQLQNISSNAKNYRSDLSTTTSTINYSLYITQISIYVAYSFLILCSLCSLIVILGIFCCNCSKLTGCVQFSWMFYWLMTTIIFIIAGIQYLAAVGIVNGCSSFHYFNSSQANFAQLGNNQFLNGYSQCLFSGAQSFIQGAFPNISVSQMTDLTNDISTFNNIGTFSTVQTSIYNSMTNYYNYPETVMITSGAQPIDALNSLNSYSNWSLNNGQFQTCKLLTDLMVFNTLNCSEIPLQNGTDNTGMNSCIQLTNSTTVGARQTYLTSGTSNCTGTSYSTPAGYLSSYASTLQTMMTQTVFQTDLLTTYAPNYYSYYNALQTYLAPFLLAQINSFIQPYNQTLNGIPCSYVIAQVNILQTQLCNNFNPYLYFLAVINISIGSICFSLMLMFYFLHPRLEFFFSENRSEMAIQGDSVMDGKNMLELVETTQRRQFN